MYIKLKIRPKLWIFIKIRPKLWIFFKKNKEIKMID